MHGNVDARPQVGEVFNGLEPAARLGVEVGQRRGEQVAESLAVAPAHAPAHLVEVAKPEVVGTVYYYGVGVGDVDAVFHDGCRQQHVVVIVGKVHDDLLQVVWLHLPVANGNAHVGYVFAYHLGYVCQLADAVVYKIHLPVAAHLKVYSVGDYLRPEGVYLRLDGVTVGRRGLYDAHVARPNERELQRARYRGGRHCERVDVDLHLAQLLFRGHAKLLLLVNDEKPQVVELHRLAYQLVGAYQYVYLTGLKVGKHGPGLLRAARPG